MGETTRVHRIRRLAAKAAALALGVGLAASLAACTSFTRTVGQPDGRRAPSASARPTSGSQAVLGTGQADDAESVAADVPAYPQIPTDTIVATGALVPVGGGATGNVSLKAFVGTDFTLHLTGLPAATGHLSLAFATKATAPVNGCSRLPGPFGISATPTAAAEQTLDVPLPDGLTAGDPTNLRQLVVMTDEAIGVCADRRVVATADLAWTWPAHRYTAATLQVVDHGERAGARGMTTTVAGHPVSYKLAGDDTQKGVLARFGIDSDQLLYLNPGYFTSGVSSTPIEGNTWNLDIGNR